MPGFPAPADRLLGAGCSIDGMHEVDLRKYVSDHPLSALAALSSYGTTYSNAFGTKPSDSFPTTAALVTGALPLWQARGCGCMLRRRSRCGPSEMLS